MVAEKATDKGFASNRTQRIWDWFLIAGFITLSIVSCIVKQNFEIVSFAAGLCSILCVIFGAKGRMENFIFGFLGSILNGYIYLHAEIYGSAALYLLYNLPMQFIGFFQWKKRQQGDGTATIKTRWMNNKQRILTAIISIALIAVIYLILQTTNGNLPVMDAVRTGIMIVTQFVLTFAFIEQWFLWLLLNSATITMWIIATIRGEQYAVIMMIQSLFFLLNSLRGVIVWIKLNKK